MNIIINFNFPIPLHNFNWHCNWSIVDQNLIVIIKRNTPPRLQTREYIPRISTLIIFSSLHAGQQEDEQFKASHCFQTTIIIVIKSLMIEEPHGGSKLCLYVVPISAQLCVCVCMCDRSYFLQTIQRATGLRPTSFHQSVLGTLMMTVFER